MSCIEKILNRRSVRKFSGASISDEVVTNILEAGRLAPSATNNQPWHFIIVRDDEGKDACDFQGFNRWVNDASFVVVGFYRQSEVIIENLSLMDVTISLQNMVIAGWVQGISSCWMGAFNERKLMNTLRLPSDARIVGAIAFGKSNETPRQPPKKEINEIFHFDKWQN